MIASNHTTRVFDAELGKLRAGVATMGELAHKQIAEALDALVRRDVVLAQRVIAADSTIDEMQRQVEAKAVETIALRQPMAVDLRSLVSMLRIVNDLERIGDLAKNISKRAIAMGGHRAQRTMPRGLRHMATLVTAQLACVLDSFVDGDSLKALKVWQSDTGVDALYASLFDELLTCTMDDPGSISMFIHLLFCAKNVERVGDHATNIAEAVHYMIEGHAFVGERPKGDSVTWAGKARDAKHWISAN